MIESSLPQSDTVALPSFGQRARSVAGYGVGTALMMITPLLVFVPAALFHCAMRNGRRAAWVAFLIATGLAALYSAQVARISPPGPAVNMAYTLFLGMVFSVALPAMLTVPLVERGEKFGNVVVFALAGGAVGLGLTEILMRTFADFSPNAQHVVQWHEQAAQMMQIYRSANAGADVMRFAQQFWQYGAQILPALFLGHIAVVFVLSLMMFATFAGAQQAQTAHAYLFRNFALPEWLLFGFVLGGLTPVTTGVVQKVAANVLALIVFLYLLQGLAIFRAMVASAGVGILGATFAIVMLVMLSLTGVGLLLLVVAGLFDPFFDFRKLKRKDDSHESHTD